MVIDEQDLEDWQEFKENAYPFSKISNKPDLQKKYIKLINVLHAKYYKHKYNEPCSCNGSIYRKRVAELDKLL